VEELLRIGDVQGEAAGVYRKVEAVKLKALAADE
jgi:hypothetical protein